MVPTVGRIVHLYPGPHRPDLCCNGNGLQDPVAAVMSECGATPTPPP